MKGQNEGAKQRDTVLCLGRIKTSFKKGGKAYICPIILILQFGIGIGIDFSFVVLIRHKEDIPDRF